MSDVDFHLYLENPPQDLSDRWSNRPLRCLSVVHPPSSANIDPENDKIRFLENLWNAQAKYRARAGQSVVLRSDEVEVESKSSKTTMARTYYNVYQRKAFLQESKKVSAQTLIGIQLFSKFQIIDKNCCSYRRFWIC